LSQNGYYSTRNVHVMVDLLQTFENIFSCWDTPRELKPIFAAASYFRTAPRPASGGSEDSAYSSRASIKIRRAARRAAQRVALLPDAIKLF